MLWNNERKQVRIAALLMKGRKQCIDVESKTPSDSQNLKLVYTSGETKNEQTILDEPFDIEVDNSVQLIRCVEMFQWIEHVHKRDNSTTYSYDKQWRNHRVDSSCF